MTSEDFHYTPQDIAYFLYCNKSTIEDEYGIVSRIWSEEKAYLEYEYALNRKFFFDSVWKAYSSYFFEADVLKVDMEDDFVVDTSLFKKVKTEEVLFKLIRLKILYQNKSHRVSYKSLRIFLKKFNRKAHSSEFVKYADAMMLYYHLYIDGEGSSLDNPYDLSIGQLSLDAPLSFKIVNFP